MSASHQLTVRRNSIAPMYPLNGRLGQLNQVRNERSVSPITHGWMILI